MSKTVEEWLKEATIKLKESEIRSAQLDSELILSRVLRVDRTLLHAHPHRKLSNQQIFHANNWLKKRSKRIPLSYIFGEKEFYGRNFIVSQDTLCPRPESEAIIDLYKKIEQKEVVLDIGTGSGILALTAKLESQNSEVFASDISEKALRIATKNAKYWNADVKFIHSDLLNSIPEEILNKTTIILANLPYVDINWVDQSKDNELHYEPQIALYAEENGLALIKKLIQQSSKLPNIKYLILEADPCQFKDIKYIASNNGLSSIEELGYAIMLKK